MSAAAGFAAEVAAHGPTYLHEQLITLTRFMADEDYPAADIADAVEKPWKYLPELREARVLADVRSVVGEGS